MLTSEAEGCSNSLLEAMTAGKPVVATNVGGNREVIRHGENGFLVPPGDDKALAETVITLLQDQDTAEAVGQRARDWATSEFSIEKMVNEYQTLYEETLVQKRGRAKRLSNQ